MTSVVMMKKMKRNSGQSLIIILLIAAVGLTVGLAVISRSVTDIKISQQEEESARVFSVAEAGIEEALRLGSVPSEPVEIGGITATVEEVSLGGESQEFAFPGEYEVGDTQTFWLVAHDSEENLTEEGRYSGDLVEIYWGKAGEDSNSPTTPAIEVTLFYKDGDGFKIKRGVFDPNSSRAASNHFEAPDFGVPPYLIAGKSFQFKKTFDLTGIPYLLRLRFFYNDSPQIIGIKGESNLPKQGVCYVSTASKEGITRKVRHCQLYKSPPAIFDYVLYSEEDIIK